MVVLIPLVVTLLFIAAGTAVVLTAAESSKESDKNEKREHILASNLQVRTTESVTVEMKNGLVGALEQVRHYPPRAYTCTLTVEQLPFSLTLDESCLLERGFCQ